MTPEGFARLTLAFGLLGNVVSFIVFLSPLRTFYKVYKFKSTEGFQSVPYVVGLFSAMLWIYYALLKGNAMLLITINCLGCFINTIYICFFLFFAPKKDRMKCLKLFGLMIVVGFGLIVSLTRILAKGKTRVTVVGWICLVFALCVFAAPLGAVRKVFKTKSVEYMPFLLSLGLTINAITWFFYGLLLHDINIAIPNILGFTFGVLQMIIYFVIKYKKPISGDKGSKNIETIEQQIILGKKDQEIIDVAKLNALICPIPVDANSKETTNVDMDDCLIVEPHMPKTNYTIEVVA